MVPLNTIDYERAKFLMERIFEQGDARSSMSIFCFPGDAKTGKDYASVEIRGYLPRGAVMPAFKHRHPWWRRAFAYCVREVRALVTAPGEPACYARQETSDATDRKACPWDGCNGTGAAGGQCRRCGTWVDFPYVKPDHDRPTERPDRDPGPEHPRG